LVQKGGKIWNGSRTGWPEISRARTNQPKKKKKGFSAGLPEKNKMARPSSPMEANRQKVEPGGNWPKGHPLGPDKLEKYQLVIAPQCKRRNPENVDLEQRKTYSGLCVSGGKGGLEKGMAEPGNGHWEISDKSFGKKVLESQKQGRGRT